MDCQTASQPDGYRPLANFSPSFWGDLFTASALDHSVYDGYHDQIKCQKEVVRAMLLDATIDPAAKMNLINLLERLSLSYHFENEIESQLEQLFDARTNFDLSDFDLYTTALQFRIFRQHGYRVSCDVFNKFTDDNGKFKETLKGDINGILSLYEATYLGIHGEDILDEALDFTTGHLRSWEATQERNSALVENVRQALRRPYHRAIPRIATRQFISDYQEDESCNDQILKFAKLDYNLLQMLHQEELRHIAKWKNDRDLTSKFPYARDRMVELYFWVCGVYFEPHYSSGRIMLNKVMAILSLLDDTYDAYGTVEELQLFTDATKRWEISATDQLPDYMKLLYTIILDFFEDVDKELSKDGRSYRVTYIKEAVKELVSSYNVEAKWCKEGYIPTFNEYTDVAYVSSGSYAVIVGSFLGMGEIADKNAFEWLRSKPKLVRVSETLGRLIDDIVSHKCEQERGHVASAVECFAKQYGLTEDEAIDKLHEMISSAWKDLNEEWLKTPKAPIFSRNLLTRIVNINRMLEVIYEYGDGYTNAEHLKDHIMGLFVNPMPMEE